MLDFNTPHGFKAITDGKVINLQTEDGRLLLSYHPAYGETILGYNKPETILNVREDLEYVKRIVDNTTTLV